MKVKYKFLLNGTLMSIVNLSMRTVSLYFSAFILSRVGEEGVGLFTLLMNVFSFAVTFVSAGIGLAVTTMVAAELGDGAPRAQRKIMRVALTYALSLSLVALVVVLGFSRPLVSYFVADMRALGPLRILALSLLPMALSSVYSGYFVARRRVVLNAAVQVLTQLLKIVLTFLALPASDLPSIAEAIVRLSTISTITETLGFLVLTVLFLFGTKTTGEKGEGREEKKAVLRPFLSITLPLSFSAYIRQALLTFEHSLIPKRLMKYGESTLSTALADYGTLHGMALPLLLYPMSPLSSFSGLLVPEFAELHGTGDRRRMSSIASRALSYTLSYALVVAVFLFVFCEELSFLIYKTPTAAQHLTLLAPIVPLMYLDHVTDAILKGIGQHVYSMWVNITDSILSIVLLYFLLPKLGIMGYGIVIVVMEGYNFLLSLIRLLQRVELHVPFARHIFLPLISALGSAMLTRSLFLLNGSTTPYFFFFLKAVFFLAVFFFFYRLCLTFQKKPLLS